MDNEQDSTAHHQEPISYDYIMMIQDQKPTTRPASTVVKFVFLASCGFAALLGGFGLQIALSGRRYRTALKTKPSKDGVACVEELEDPVLFASRALAWGTLYSILGTGSIGLAAVGIWKLLVTLKNLSSTEEFLIAHDSFCRFSITTGTKEANEHSQI